MVSHGFSEEAVEGRLKQKIWDVGLQRHASATDECTKTDESVVHRKSFYGFHGLSQLCSRCLKECLCSCRCSVSCLYELISFCHSKVVPIIFPPTSSCPRGALSGPSSGFRRPGIPKFRVVGSLNP